MRCAGLCGLILLLAVTSARAEDPAEDRWQLELTGYGWIPELHGRAVVRGASIPIDVGFDDIFDLLGDGDLFGAGMWFAVRHGRFSLFADVFGTLVDVEENIGDRTVFVEGPRGRLLPVHVPPGRIEVRVDNEIVAFGMGYRVLDLKLEGAGDRRFWLEPFVGARYTHLGIDIDTSLGQRALATNEDFDFADPLLGARWAIDVCDPLEFSFSGDIGGFGASSELVWSLQGLFGYRLPWTLFGGELRAVAGYRVLDYDRDDGALEDVDIQYRGPLLGLAGRF